MQSMPFVLVQVLERPFITRIGEEIDIIRRSFRSLLIIARHVTFRNRHKEMIIAGDTGCEGIECEFSMRVVD
jgi:hypothetical protein